MHECKAFFARSWPLPGSGMIYNEAGYRLRLQIDKLVRTNLTIDFGMGTDHSGGIYFNLS